MTTNIYWLTKDEAFQEMHDICTQIYGARNIWLSSEDILEQLKRIDKMFRDCNFTGYDEDKKRLMDECAKEICLTN